jgi:hypothetical protein
LNVASTEARMLLIASLPSRRQAVG